MANLINTKTAEDILRVLMSQDFFDFHEGEFKRFIDGEPDAKTKEEILKEIELVFCF